MPSDDGDESARETERIGLARPKRRRLRRTLVVLGVLALAGGAAVGVVTLNEYENRPRAMHHDVLLMAGLQYDLLASGQPGVELVVDESSPPVLVGDVAFEVSPGVEIVVEERDGEFCVLGRNQYGDETAWHCTDGSGSRPDMGTLEDEVF